MCGKRICITWKKIMQKIYENFANSSMKRPHMCKSSANILCDHFIVANVDISFRNMLFLFAYASSLCHTLQNIRKCEYSLILIELNYSDSKGASANEPCYIFCIFRFKISCGALLVCMTNINQLWRVMLSPLLGVFRSRQAG